MLITVYSLHKRRFCTVAMELIGVMSWCCVDVWTFVRSSIRPSRKIIRSKRLDVEVALLHSYTFQPNHLSLVFKFKDKYSEIDCVYNNVRSVFASWYGTLGRRTSPKSTLLLTSNFKVKLCETMLTAYGSCQRLVI